MVSGYSTFTSIPRVDGLSTRPPRLGCHSGALFSAKSYDANDNMFPLACGVMSSENYDGLS